MKILLLGKFGQLGWELQRALATLGEISALDYPEIDLVHAEQLRPVIRKVKPQSLSTRLPIRLWIKQRASLHCPGNQCTGSGVMAEEARDRGKPGPLSPPIMS
jgi:dTDP-4-dehydrorhamnose reductase